MVEDSSLVESREVGPYTIELHDQGQSVPTFRKGNRPVNEYELRIRPADDEELQATFPYWDSVNATQNEEVADLTDVLSAVLDEGLYILSEFGYPIPPGSDDPEYTERFGEFFDHYGYTDAGEALQSWRAMNDNAAQLLGVMKEDDIYAMAECARDDGDLSEFDQQPA